MSKDILDTELIYDGDFIRVHMDKIQLPNGKILNKETVDRIDKAVVVPIISEEKNKIVLVEQYIAGESDYWLGLPGGGRDLNGSIGEYMESPLKTAKRELWEETSYRAKKWDLLYYKKRRGTINQDLFYYVATDLYKGRGARHIDEKEPLRVKEMDFREAVDMAFGLKFASEATNLMIIAAAKKLGFADCKY